MHQLSGPLPEFLPRLPERGQDPTPGTVEIKNEHVQTILRAEMGAWKFQPPKHTPGVASSPPPMLLLPSARVPDRERVQAAVTRYAVQQFQGKVKYLPEYQALGVVIPQVAFDRFVATRERECNERGGAIDLARRGGAMGNDTLVAEQLLFERPIAAWDRGAYVLTALGILSPDDIQSVHDSFGKLGIPVAVRSWSDASRHRNATWRNEENALFEAEKPRVNGAAGFTEICVPAGAFVHEFLDLKRLTSSHKYERLSVHPQVRQIAQRALADPERWSVDAERRGRDDLDLAGLAARLSKCGFDAFHDDHDRVVFEWDMAESELGDLEGRPRTFKALHIASGDLLRKLGVRKVADSLSDVNGEFESTALIPIIPINMSGALLPRLIELISRHNGR